MNKEIVAMIETYSVSLVFVKIDNIKTDSLLRCIIIEANSEDEALGKAINHFREETKNHNLSMRVVIPIAGRSKNIEIEKQKDEIIAELEKQNRDYYNINVSRQFQIKTKDERIKELEDGLKKLYDAIDSCIELTPELLSEIKQLLNKNS